MRYVIGAAVVLTLSVSAPSSAQSLADAAKKAEEARAKSAADSKEQKEAEAKKDSPKTVFTNKDLKDDRPNFAATTGADSTSTPATAAVKVEEAPAPKPDELERQRAEAAVLFKSDMEFIFRNEAAITEAQRQYRAGCAGKKSVAEQMVVGPFGLAYSVPTIIDNETTPPCRILVAEIERDAKSIVKAAEGIREVARTKGIWPGVIRSLLGK